MTADTNRYDERYNHDRTIVLKLLQCEATTKQGKQCRMVPIYRGPDDRLLCAVHGYWL